jgi:hypothetical protein
LMPSSLQARRMRRAISPRLAMTTFLSIWNQSLLNSLLVVLALITQ